jgi:hypothetical protein
VRTRTRTVMMATLISGLRIDIKRDSLGSRRGGAGGFRDVLCWH